MGRRSDIMVFYDNFNYMQKAHHQLISDRSKMYNYTTAKVVCGGSRVPAGGLRQSMLNQQFILKPEHILRSNDLKNDSIWSDIQRYLIFNAIKRIYPTAVDKIYKGGNVEQRSMPQLEILPCTRTEHFTMGAIMENEASVAGNYRVLENIFLEQLGIDKESGFQDRLFLAHGDHKTCENIRSCQRQRLESSDVYHRLGCFSDWPLASTAQLSQVDHGNLLWRSKIL